ncbi:transcriptional regulator, MerR family [Paenibacillus curdlanolyticus YK9]|uniref:Transcriptional regulator, MerR family n=1 Tax=Paenibacillus curdlanolyticus YK9 TaxID=717606 RepID=E0IDI8_9BACL|nr:MerR family transcriptional regulator [Paenibacillus curdlanolyticus]EFM09643.1 transcriptional regulator, MerR family [Paenibacillus curdlanolyticus YK9]
MTQLIKIGLFSTIAQVTIRTLRHYDDFGLLKPAHIDPDTSYRYYTFDQLIRLNQIQAFKDMGLALDQIADLLNRQQPIADTIATIEAKKAELARDIREKHEQLGRLEARLHRLSALEGPPKYEVVMKQVPSLHIVALRRIVPTPLDMPAYRCRMFDELDGWLDGQAFEVQQEYVLYHMTEFVETDFDIEVAVAVSPPKANGKPKMSLQTVTAGAAVPEAIRRYELPSARLVASVVHQGAFMDVKDALLELFDWMGMNGYSPIGPVRELHLFGRENQCVDPQNVIVELQVPIAANERVER